MALKRAMPHGHNYDVEKYKYVYLPLASYGGYAAIANASDQADIAAEDAVASLGAGAASIGEVTDSSIAGLHVDDTADAVGILWPVPYDCDAASPIEFAVIWNSNTSTTTEYVTWAVTYTALTVDTSPIEVGATALSTAIAADYQAGYACAIQQTAWGVLNGGTVSQGQWLSLNVAYSAESGIDCSSDAVHGLYLVIRYVRRAL